MPRNNRTARGSRKAKPETPEAELRLEAVRNSIAREVVKGLNVYTVQNVSGNAPDSKSWVCPHCHVEIKAGTPHVVAYDAVRGIETRRHFHTSCFKSFQGTLL